MSIRAGTSYHDLQEVKKLELTEPDGWVRIPLQSADGRPLRANMIQVAVLSNHQNGRDTHLRLIEIFTSLAYAPLPIPHLCIAVQPCNRRTNSDPFCPFTLCLTLSV